MKGTEMMDQITVIRKPTTQGMEDLFSENYVTLPFRMNRTSRAQFLDET
jgi:hypothetical protein